MRGSKFEGGGEGWRRNTAQYGNSSWIFWAVDILANNMNSSTIELVSLKAMQDVAVKDKNNNKTYFWKGKNFNYKAYKDF